MVAIRVNVVVTAVLIKTHFRYNCYCNGLQLSINNKSAIPQKLMILSCGMIMPGEISLKGNCTKELKKER